MSQPTSIKTGPAAPWIFVALILLLSDQGLIWAASFVLPTLPRLLPLLNWIGISLIPCVAGALILALLKSQDRPVRRWTALLITGATAALLLSLSLTATQARQDNVPNALEDLGSRVEILPPAVAQNAGLPSPAIAIYGSIARSTVSGLQRAVETLAARHERPASIVLSSGGGLTSAVAPMLDLIVKLNPAETLAMGTCESACAAIWAGSPHHQLAADSAVCFHGSHDRSGAQTPVENRQLLAAIEDAANRNLALDATLDGARRTQLAGRLHAALPALLAHGLGELVCPSPATLVADGLLMQADVQTYPEAVARFVRANPPRCDQPVRIPALPPTASSDREDGCSSSDAATDSAHPRGTP